MQKRGSDSSRSQDIPSKSQNSVINIPSFYRTEFNEHSRQTYEITVWFRREMVFFNLSRSEEFLLNVRTQNFSCIIQPSFMMGNILQCPLAGIATLPSATTSCGSDLIRILQERVAEQKQQLTAEKKLNDKSTLLLGL